ncbi:GntR family transcriptional regulator [Rhizobium halophytocola]|uniref:DNA-binding GntR family transcriptional regulator n=1 Tax=Rhizobium halophytocola TaxID=735519 RepID=A0ABS4E4T9_9HYPH|nr:FCD domain-containing protein [Rhizobium halophytocola]MBP1852965.1 DNA-binding GntR family transcriptional regulator [Rhizobium halophytocola]
MAVRDGNTAETAGDQASRRIRADIISGTLRPGSKLKLDEARRRYDVSVSTLREILSGLAAERLIVAEGQRGFTVSPATKAELLELAELRILLECHAIPQSFAAGDLDWEAQVVAAHYKLSSAERALLEGREKRSLDWVRFDWEFHHALVGACRSTSLMTMLNSIFDRFLRYHLLAESFRGEAVVGEHQTLFEFAMKRDAPATVDLIRNHVMRGADQVIQSGLFS